MTYAGDGILELRGRSQLAQHQVQRDCPSRDLRCGRHPPLESPQTHMGTHDDDGRRTDWRTSVHPLVVPCIVQPDVITRREFQFKNYYRSVRQTYQRAGKVEGSRSIKQKTVDLSIIDTPRTRMSRSHSPWFGIMRAPSSRITPHRLVGGGVVRLQFWCPGGGGGKNGRSHVLEDSYQFNSHCMG